MNPKKKKVLFILGGGAAALVLVIVVFALTFDINSYRPRIEAAAFGATGLEVRINGKMGLSFPLAYRLRISTSPTREAKSFPSKTSSWGWS
jgi:uncharacterized protein involved in outer membrane biogenesis